MRLRRRRPDAGPPGTVDVAASGDVPTAPPFLEVKVAGERVLLVRTPAGLAAFGAACPHLGQPLKRGELDGTTLTCRHHRHRYDVTDGTCVWPGPGDDGLVLLEAGETDGRVWVRPPTGRG